jgi:hypothetical protein
VNCDISAREISLVLFALGEARERLVKDCAVSDGELAELVDKLGEEVQ